MAALIYQEKLKYYETNIDNSSFFISFISNWLYLQNLPDVH